MDIKLFTIFFITCFFSFGIQTLFYFWYFIRREPIIKKYKTVFNYFSGFIGDALLIPLANVFAYLSLKNAHFPVLDYVIWLFALIIGLTATLVMHFGQKHYNLTNWTMPQKGKWTILGIYHSLFMFVETVFLSFTLLSFLKAILIEGKSSDGVPIKFGLLIMFLFLLTFIFDYWKPLFKSFLFRKKKL